MAYYSGDPNRYQATYAAASQGLGSYIATGLSGVVQGVQLGMKLKQEKQQIELNRAHAKFFGARGDLMASQAETAKQNADFMNSPVGENDLLNPLVTHKETYVDPQGNPIDAQVTERRFDPATTMWKMEHQAQAAMIVEKYDQATFGLNQARQGIAIQSEAIDAQGRELPTYLSRLGNKGGGSTGMYSPPGMGTQAIPQANQYRAVPGPVPSAASQAPVAVMESEIPWDMREDPFSPYSGDAASDSGGVIQ